MTDFGDHLPRRYFVDTDGRRVLIGLTPEETFEFETLESLLALDENGRCVASDENGVLGTMRQTRWLELYRKHDSAWRRWMTETHADRNRNLSFINQDRVIWSILPPASAALDRT